MIIAFDKEIGETMNQFIERFNKLHPNKKVAYSGRLDPLAFGQIMMFTDDDVHQMNDHVKKNKKYTFKLLNGIQTDTYDIMGLVSDKFTDPVDVKLGEQKMLYPPFSCYLIKEHREPLWKCTKNGLPITNYPSKQVNVISYKITNTYKISTNELKSLINEKINKVTKQTFRQSEILEKWNDHLTESKEFTITEHEISISSGAYVRHFGNQLGGTCFDINRICYLD
jgi:tRNA U55 pseudouridine synthase TruB